MAESGDAQGHPPGTGPAGPPGYSAAAGTDEYPMAEESPKPEEPWARLGYASHLDMVNDIALNQARLGGEKWVERFVEDELGQVSIEIVPLDIERPKRRRTARQVNVKLSEEDYENLAWVAKRHGVRRSTFARIVLSRVARAMVERESEDEAPSISYRSSGE